MPHHITYLIGAGASAQSIPVVKNMANEVEKTLSKFDQLIQNEIGIPKNGQFVFQRIKTKMMELSKACAENHSIDTYAKKLYHVDKKKFIELKKSLTIFFTLRQKLEPVDHRYDNFWAAISSPTERLPDNIKIISWNYDSQAEISFQGFTLFPELSSVYSYLNISSFRDNNLVANTDKFKIFKLNGSAKVDLKGSGPNFLVDRFDKNDSDYFEELWPVLEKLDSVESNEQLELSFAWEHDIESAYYKKVKESLYKTTVLVVIGYSFPVFNRKIDKFIINDCMYDIQKVYIQSPDAENVAERFQSLHQLKRVRNNIILVKDTDQFTFPYELDI